MKNWVVMRYLVFMSFAALPLQAAKQEQSEVFARASYNNVKLFYQPGTSTKILKILTRNDQFKVVRKHNNTWSIVTIDTLVGYVLTSEIDWKTSHKLYTFRNPD